MNTPGIQLHRMLGAAVRLLCLFLPGLGLLPQASHARPCAWNLYSMVNAADAIVIGFHGDGDSASVVKWIRGPAGATPGVIEIADLGRHGRKIDTFTTGWPPQTQPPLPPTVTSRRFVAFLQLKEGRWHAIQTQDEDSSGLCGSCGIAWIQEGTCYRYLQDFMNTNDLYLWNEFPQEKDLLAAIEVGQADQAAWSAALKIESPAARAAALAAYTMASTSPEHPRSTHRVHNEVLVAMAAGAVPALRHQIAVWQPGDSLSGVVLSLHQIGPEARAAVPDLIGLLNQPERASPYYVLCALRTTADATVIPHIIPFLKHADEQVREGASEAIKALKALKPLLQEQSGG